VLRRRLPDADDLVTDDTPFRDRGPLSEVDAISILANASIDVVGRMPWSSNATFLVDLQCDDHVPAQAIYKPHRGERPLWDFPDGLYRREIAAFRLSRQLGWGLVPPTVERDGPLGVGSVQLLVRTDYRAHYFTMIKTEHHHEALQRLCVLDVLANSTDRKSGHCLLDEDGSVWAIDNGLSFHHEFKLRTVIWEWASEPIPDGILDDVASMVDDGLTDELAELLDPVEHEAVLERARSVVAEGRFPVDPTGRRYPWPLI